MVPALALLLPLLAISLPRISSRVISKMLPDRETLAERTISGIHFKHERDFRLPDWLDSRLRQLRVNHEPAIYGHFLRGLGPKGFDLNIADWSIEFGGSPPRQSAIGFNASYALTDVPVADLDGDSVPDLVVVAYSGGAHCCWTYFLIRLGADPGLIANITFENGASFDRRSDDNSAETIITSTDSVWNYWQSCYACTFKPLIILRLKNGTLSLAPDLMAKPLPADFADIERRMTEIISKVDFTLQEERVEPADYWHFVVELIYTGHEEEAIDLVRRTWTENGPERELFLAELLANFESSPWAPAMRRHFGNER